MERIISIEELVASMVDGILILYLLNCCFSKVKVKIDFGMVAYCICTFVLSHFLGQNFLIQSVAIILVIVLYCKRRLNTGYFSGIAAGIAINVGLALVNIAIIFLVSVFSGNSMEQLISETSMSRVVVLILSKVTCMFAGIVLVNTISHFVSFKVYQWVYISIYYLSTFIICVLVSMLLIGGDFNFAEKVTMLCIVLLIVFINIITFFIVIRINNDNRMEQENKMLNLQIKNQQNMIVKTSELYEHTRALRHDMKHYFITFRGMLNNGKTELVIKEMNKIIDYQFENVSILNISNPYLSAAINDKLDECHRMEISTDFRICGEIPEHMSMDMALIVSNLLDNAIEAEIKEDNKFIKFLLQEEDGSTILEVRNYIGASVLKKGDGLKTHKADKMIHGYGIKNVRKIIKKYNGYIDFREEGKEFVVTIMI